MRKILINFIFVFILFNRETGEMISQLRWDAMPVDPATQVRIEFPRMINPQTERWDGATGVRPATQAEINSYDAADPQVIRERAREKLRKRRGSPDPFTRSEDFDALLDYLGIQ